jgi:hypothetical protein
MEIIENIKYMCIEKISIGCLVTNNGKSVKRDNLKKKMAAVEETVKISQGFYRMEGTYYII